MHHVIDRHYPGVEGPLALLDAVTARQARLIRRYMGTGLPVREVMRLDDEIVDVGQLRGLARALGAQDGGP